MKYAIIGSGKIGTAALARTFARNNIQVAIANSRGPETLASLAEKLGPSVWDESKHPGAAAGRVLIEQ
jgi:8-hydroxy-5-deazaflavin:NADPH oxidoreductase